jgi:glycosyltransferase involved in cell wall biosynthesis
MIGGDGPERARLQEQAHALGIADAVEFTGWIAPPAVPQLLARASVVLIPSRAEGFGLTALEAAWAGRPIVACAVGGLAEQLSHGETALLVPPQNPAALAAAAIELLSDRRRALAIAAGARRAAGRAATVDECADRHEYLYGELIARWATPRRRRGEAV